MAQALAACQNVCSDRSLHSFTCYFLRGGDAKSDVVFETAQLSSGRSFAAMHANALQEAGPILSMTASFQKAEQGLEHQAAPGLQPEWSRPELLPSLYDHMAPVLHRVPVGMRGLYTAETSPFDIRPNVFVAPWDAEAQEDTCRAFWIRVREPLPDDLRVHQRLLTYISDWGLLEASVLPHPVALWGGRLQVASLSHSMHFHHEFRLDREWHCHVMRSPKSTGGRGFCLGEVWSESGVLVASTAQEGLIRVRPRRQAGPV